MGKNYIFYSAFFIYLNLLKYSTEAKKCLLLYLWKSIDYQKYWQKYTLNSTGFLQYQPEGINILQ